MEFLSIFAWNLGFSLIVLAANTFRSIRTPMGYLAVLVMWVQGAVIWGRTRWRSRQDDSPPYHRSYWDEAVSTNSRLLWLSQ
jgi:hypothetical protein